MSSLPLPTFPELRINPKTMPKMTVITGIICLAALEGLAIIKGIDGIMFTTIVAVIALAIGITIPGIKQKG